jgi:glycosyltransferase involved in cell wall biosynthesis
VRVLVFNPSYPPVPCGIGDYNRGLATALAHAGNDVVVVTAAGATAPSEGPPRVLPVLRDWSVREFLRARRRFARPRPDVVISGFPSVMLGSHARLLYLLPGLAKLTLGRPRTVFVVHEFVRTGETERRLLRLALSAADLVIAVTEAERDAVVARYPRVARRTTVLHNAPTIPAVTEDLAAEGRTRDELAGASGELVAYFGLLKTPEKGFDDLLDAIATTDATLAVTGSLDPEQPYHAEVAARIARLGLGDRVRWLGYVDDEDVARLLRAADAVVLPFRGGAESGYTSLLAAIVNGAAVITTRGPNNPDWLRDSETAVLVDPSDPAAIAAALAKLRAEPELAAGVRAGAGALRFGWDAIAEAIAGTAAPG